jgi:hypothetical protein
MKTACSRFAVVLGLLVLSSGLSAADAAPSSPFGKWAAVFESNRGQLAATYVFKVDGDKLTGTASSATFTGEGVLSAIKIEKDIITFTESFNFDGMRLRFEYTGQLNGE